MLHAIRPQLNKILAPAGRTLARAGFTPNAITVIGTAGVTAGALAFYPRGQFFVGTLVITFFVFSDMLDGVVARITGTSGTFGAFLDSTLDRVGDAAVFSGLILWFGGHGHNSLLLVLSIYCLVSGSIISYVKARAEGLGLRCDVGIAERPERLLIILIATGLSGLGVPYLQAAALWILAALSTITVGQRVREVWRQAGPRGATVTVGAADTDETADTGGTAGVRQTGGEAKP